MKIAFFDAKPYDIPDFDRHGAEQGVNFKYFETKLTPDTVWLARDFEGVCVFVNDCVNAAVIARLANLGVKYIALRCAGFNNVDLSAASAHRLRVCRVPAYSPYAIAEHTAALLLTSVRRIHKAYIRTRDFNFSLSGLTGFDLHGKTVGIIGTGRIGRVFADICRGLCMKILAYDKFPAPNAGFQYTDLDTLLTASDVISLHCPLTEETYHIIGESSLKKCKPGVMILNTSRGALVDAEALLSAIKERRIGGACLDVYEEESDLFFKDFSGHILEDDVLARLISMPNVIVTSHQAYLTKEALENIAETTVANLVCFTENKPCENEIHHKIQANP